MFRSRREVAGIPCELGRAYMRLCKARVQHQSVFDGNTTFRKGNVVRNGAIAGLRRIGCGKADPGARTSRIEPKRLLVKLHGGLDVAGCATIVEKAALQIRRERF